MARDIVITPNRDLSGSTTYPEIRFSGLTGASISLKVEDSGSLTFEGDTGTLFSIVDDKDGLLNSVNDISGLPVFSVYSDKRVLIGSTATTASQLYVYGSATITESFVTRASSPAQLTNNTNNWAIPDSDFIRMDSNSFWNLTGIAGGVDGRRITLVNISSSSTVSLQNEDVSSTAANRVITSNGTSLTIGTKKSAILIYDATTARWRHIGGTAT